MTHRDERGSGGADSTAGRTKPLLCSGAGIASSRGETRTMTEFNRPRTRRQRRRATVGNETESDCSSPPDSRLAETELQLNAPVAEGESSGRAIAAPRTKDWNSVTMLAVFKHVRRAKVPRQ
jgi:hypothetical protein